jgi:hypothetical protein
LQFAPPFLFFGGGLNFFLEILLFWQVIYDKTTGRSRGFGFVTMSTVEEVEAAAHQLNGYVMLVMVMPILVLPTVFMWATSPVFFGLVLLVVLPLGGIWE